MIVLIVLFYDTHIFGGALRGFITLRLPILISADTLGRFCAGCSDNADSADLSHCRSKVRCYALISVIRNLSSVTQLSLRINVCDRDKIHSLILDKRSFRLELLFF